MFQTISQNPTQTLDSNLTKTPFPTYKTSAHPIKRAKTVSFFKWNSNKSDRIKETYFISHGTTMMSIDKSVPARSFLQSWQDEVFSTIPSSILVVSAHWDTDIPAVNSVSHSQLVYDFYGFPAPLYQLKYPAPGAPNLAKKVQQLLTSSGFKCALDKKRGLDHGSWVPLMLMYPEARIPVCQLSVQSNLDAAHHYKLGRALAPLKDQGVLIVGSGSAVHPSNDTPGAVFGVARWAVEFDQWLEKALTRGRYEDVIDYKRKAPNWKLAHPWPNHLYPLHVAMGAAGENSKTDLIHRSWEGGILGYASYRFTSR